MRIIVDAMGGDNAPEQIVIGSIMAAKALDAEITLVGAEEKISGFLTEKSLDGFAKVKVINALEKVEMNDNPATVLREKKDSSMAVALRLLNEEGYDALVSAGNTGALLSGATLITKRIKGIRRAALAPVIPTKTGGALLIDCGANAECTPEYLLQFALMGSHYAGKVLNINSPRVGLLNNGTEESKGTELYKKSHELLKSAGEDKLINFVGNVEGREIAFGGADVFVCDGFTGNVVLKTIEGMGLFFAGEIKDMLTKSVFTKMSALALKKGFRAFKKKLDFKETGGAPLLGVSKPVIKAHGSSDAYTFFNAVRQASLFVKADIIKSITDDIEKLKVGEKTETGA